MKYGAVSKYYFVIGSGCCNMSMKSLISPEIDLAGYFIFETKSIEMADVIVIFGCINNITAHTINDEMISNKEAVIMRAGRCIIDGCRADEDILLLKERIVCNLDGCPPSPEEIAGALIKLFSGKRENDK